MSVQSIVDVEDTVRLVMRIEVVTEDLRLLRLMEVLKHTQGFNAALRGVKNEDIVVSIIDGNGYDSVDYKTRVVQSDSDVIPRLFCSTWAFPVDSSWVGGILELAPVPFALFGLDASYVECGIVNNFGHTCHVFINQEP